MSFEQLDNGATARLQNAFNRLLRGDNGSVSSIAVLAIATLPIVLVLLKKVLYPTFDPCEPPVIRPKVPFIGHLVSLIKETNSFYVRLYNEHKLPICTLPVLSGKIYVINSPTLIGAAMRNPSLSFDPFQLEFATGALGLTPAMVKRFSADGVLWSINKAIHEGLLGENVLRLMARALNDLSAVINSVPPAAPLEVPSSYDWLRAQMGLAAMNGLLGEKNPFREEALDCIWEYDKAVGILAVAPAAGLLAPKGIKARNRLQALLKPFYVAHYDERPDCSALIRLRGRLMRNLGLTSEEICLCEISMPWASVTNTTVALYWLFAHVFSRPDYISRIREELSAVTNITERSGHRVATVDATLLENNCPFLLASYREALRLYDDVIGNRRVMEDTTLQDVDGREYLLKKGTNVQWTAGVTGTHGSCWGDKIKEYDPERWLNASIEEEKARRSAFIPFGGGKYLCPGRQFAVVEILGFIGALALGFKVEGVKVAPDQNPYIAGAMRQPILTAVDMGVKIYRREGWEDVEWRFYCAGF